MQSGGSDPAPGTHRERRVVNDGPMAGQMVCCGLAHLSFRRDSEPGLAATRQYTHTGRPLGAAPFIHTLERETQRALTAQKGG
jgi:hypothetical protein